MAAVGALAAELAARRPPAAERARAAAWVDPGNSPPHPDVGHAGPGPGRLIADDVRDDPSVSSDLRAWIGTVLRLVLSGILFWSGLAKLLEADQTTREAILAYRVFPPAWPYFLRLGAARRRGGACAALLLIGLFTRIAALPTALLMLGFIVGIRACGSAATPSTAAASAAAAT